MLLYWHSTYYKELDSGGGEASMNIRRDLYMPRCLYQMMILQLVGTINLDYRSLYLHFECGAYIYDHPVVADIEQDFQETLKKCQKISLTEVENRPVTYKVMGQILRLIAPLM